LKGEGDEMTDKEAYDKIFNILADAEMGLRNKDYWYVANRCQCARDEALKFDKEKNIDDKKDITFKQN
jgi:hypothetical protein